MWIWIADTGHCFWRPPETRITWEDGVCWDPNRSLWFTHLRLRFFTYWGPFGLPKFEKVYISSMSTYIYKIILSHNIVSLLHCLVKISWNPHVTWNLRCFLLRGVWSFAKLAFASEPFLAAGWPWGHRVTTGSHGFKDDDDDDEDEHSRHRREIPQKHNPDVWCLRMGQTDSQQSEPIYLDDQRRRSFPFRSGWTMISANITARKKQCPKP